METEGKKLAECSPLWGLDRLSLRQPAVFSPSFARILYLSCISSRCLLSFFRLSSSCHNVIYADKQGEVAQKAKRRLCSSCTVSRLILPFSAPSISLFLTLFLFFSLSLRYRFRSFAGALHSTAVREFSLRDDFSEEIQTPFRESWRTAKFTWWPRLCWFRSGTHMLGTIDIYIHATRILDCIARNVYFAI